MVVERIVAGLVGLVFIKLTCLSAPGCQIYQFWLDRTAVAKQVLLQVPLHIIFTNVVFCILRERQFSARAPCSMNFFFQKKIQIRRFKKIFKNTRM
jgi:hypothetical protein